MAGVSKNRFVALATLLIGGVITYALLMFNPRASSYNQYIVGNLIGLFWIPMLAILFIHREEPNKFGFQLGSSRIWWVVAGLMYVGVVGLMLFVYRGQAFQSYYPLFRNYPEFLAAFSRYPEVSPFASAPWLMVYAFASYGMYLFCWEFFFRGYLLFGLARSIGWGAILVQAVAFGLLHAGKPTLEVVGSFGAGVILGIIALNARSFVPCFVLHWAASLTFDLLVIAGRPH